jgi:O-antigen/teichoic acid export membrane protein
MTVATVVSGMVFARYLTVADYGTYLQTFLAYDVAVPLLTLGLPSALFYFLPGSSRPKTLVLETMIVLFIAGSLFSLFLLSGGTELLAKRFNNPDLSGTLKWMFFYPIYTFPVLIIGSVLVVGNKTTANAVYNVVTGLVLTLSVIFCAIITRSYEAPLLMRILLPVLFFPVAVYLCFKYLPGKLDKPEIKSACKIIKFAVPLGLATIFEGLSLQIANIIVSSLCTSEEYAIYANGAREIPLIGIITSSVSVVIMAEMAEKCKAGEKHKALELFRKAALLCACFLLPAMCFLMFYADDFIRIMFTDKYADSVLPFRIYLLLLPVRIVNYGAAFIALGQSKKIMYRSFVSLLITAALCYVLVSAWRMYGATLAIVATIYMWVIPYNWYMLGREFQCKIRHLLPLKRIGAIFILSISTALASSLFLFVNASPLINFSGGAICFCAIYVLVFYKYVPEYRCMINSKLALWNFKK